MLNLDNKNICLEQVFLVASDMKGTREEFYEVAIQDVSKMSNVLQSVNVKKLPVPDLVVLMNELIGDASKTDFMKLMKNNKALHANSLDLTKSIVMNALFIAQNVILGTSDFFEVDEKDIMIITSNVKYIKTRQIAVPELAYNISKLILRSQGNKEKSNPQRNQEHSSQPIQYQYEGQEMMSTRSLQHPLPGHLSLAREHALPNFDYQQIGHNQEKKI